jgi:hypothetical protein
MEDNVPMLTVGNPADMLGIRSNRREGRFMGAGPRMQARSVTDTSLTELLDQTLRDPDSYEPGESPTSEDALKIARRLLADREVQKFPDASMAPFEGGILIVWKRADRDVTLLCAADRQKSYIYKGETENRNTVSELIRDVNRNALLQSLRWLYGIE